MRYYGGNYEFECENKEFLFSGKCQFSFHYDEESEETIGLEIDIFEVKGWQIEKEQEITRIRNYHKDIIHNLICSQVVDYALVHDLTDDF